MRLSRIHVDRPLAPDTELALPDEAARYVARVLRLREGAPLVLFDGRGGEYAARVAAVERSRVSVAVGAHDAVERESPLSVHAGIGLARGDRMDFAVQKAVELGAARITPLALAHCVVHLDAARGAAKQAHWQRIAASACEQCGRNRVPAVDAPAELAPWLGSHGGSGGLVFTPQAGVRLRELAPMPGPLAVLLGPEGGLSPAEIGAARDAGFEAVALGPRILRAETAVAATLSALQCLWGDA